MALIGRCNQPLKIPLLSLFSQPCLRARSLSKYPLLKSRILSLRHEKRTFTTSPTSPEKKYTKDHEWVELSEDGKIGTIGISTYAAKALGDVVYIELPELGLEVAAGDTIGAVESVKSASDILTPLKGKVIAANEELENQPGIINKSPEEDGWIARVEVQGDMVEGLMDGNAYNKFTEE